MYFHRTNLVLTKEGYKSLEELENKFTEIWNGFEWIKILPVSSEKEIEFYKYPMTVTYSDGTVESFTFTATEETLFFCFLENLCQYRLLSFSDIKEIKESLKPFEAYPISIDYKYEPNSDLIYYIPEVNTNKILFEKDKAICITTSNKFICVDGILLPSFSKYNSDEDIKRNYNEY